MAVDRFANEQNKRHQLFTVDALWPVHFQQQNLLLLLITRCLICDHSIKCIIDFYIQEGLVMLIQQKFGQKIQLLRKEQGLSQEKFALLIDMDRTYYASVEAGKRNISLVNIQKIATGLGVPISKLFEDIE